MKEFELDIENKEAVFKWLDDIRNRSGNAIPLWKAVTPKLQEFIEYEFHPSRDGHKLWSRLNVNYLLWKIHVKKVSGIGYLSGTMAEAAGKSAIKTYSPMSLTWKLNSGMVSSNGGYDYSKVFHYGTKNQTKGKGKRVQRPRPIYKYTTLRLNNFLKLDVKRFNDGTTHANFIYNWLKKALKEGYK